MAARTTIRKKAGKKARRKTAKKARAATRPIRILVLRAPGTNCDRETGYAFEREGACQYSTSIKHNPCAGAV